MLNQPANPRPANDVDSEYPIVLPKASPNSWARIAQLLGQNVEVLFDDCLSMAIWREPIVRQMTDSFQAGALSISAIKYLAPDYTILIDADFESLKSSANNSKTTLREIDEQQRPALFFVSDFGFTNSSNQRADLLRELCDKYFVILIPVLEIRLLDRTILGGSTGFASLEGKETTNQNLKFFPDQEEERFPDPLLLPFIQIDDLRANENGTFTFLNRPHSSLDAICVTCLEGIDLNESSPQNTMTKLKPLDLCDRDQVREKLDSFRQVATEETFELFKMMVALPGNPELVLAVHELEKGTRNLQSMSHILGSGFLRRIDGSELETVEFIGDSRNLLLEHLPVQGIVRSLNALSRYVESNLNIPGGLSSFITEPNTRSQLPTLIQALGTFCEKIAVDLKIHTDWHSTHNEL